MTLLEVVVALTIATFAAVGGYAALGTLVDRRHAVERATDDVARAAGVRRTLVWWLADAHLTVEQDAPFRGLDGEYQREPDDEITFLTTAPTPLGAGETVVRLYVARDTSERGLVAELHEWRGATTRRVILEPHVTALDVRYRTGVLGARQWLPSWISSSVLPAGVELTLAASPADSLAPLLRLPIVLPLGGGR